MQTYKVFKSTEFVDRDDKWKYVQDFQKDKGRGVIIFEGERGSGKTSLLLEIYRRFLQQPEFIPFLISLSPYSAPEFEGDKNIWIRETPFRTEEIPALLHQLANSLGIEFIQSNDREIQKEYMARGLAYRAPKNIPVLLIDSIYECSEEIRIEIEKYVLAPILTSERVFIFLSGRGKRPIWSRPELQTAEISELHPLEKIFVKEQLERMKSNRVGEYKEITNLSNGYPLIVRVMGESKKTLTDALNDAIDILITETLPENEREEIRYLNIRSQIEKLSLVSIPFRIPDVEEYLYPNNAERRAETNNLINILLASHILFYEGKGYQLNQSIAHPIRKWLALQRIGSTYLKQLQDISIKLQNEYPSAKAWYQQMIPSGQIMTHH